MLYDQITRLQRSLDAERRTAENLRAERDALLDALRQAQIERDAAVRAASEAARAIHAPRRQ